MRAALLIILAVLSIAAATLRATGRLSSGPATPRDLAAEFLGSLEAGEGGAATAGGAALFTDVATALGIEFTHDNAFAGEFMLPEEMGPGAAFVDADGDGDLDVFVTGGGAIVEGPAQTCRLFRNDGDRFVDVTEETGAGVPGPAYGVACADIDDDGDVDVFLTRLGANALLVNDGTGRFRESARAAGLDDPGFGASATFFDYDRDGRLDLYVANYIDWSIDRETACYTILGVRDYCNPTVYDAPARDKLYRNLGAGRFEDVSGSAGIDGEAGNGLGVIASDFDGDGWPDLYVANDQTPAFLWRNRGDGTFENVATMAGCAYDGRGVAIAGMGVARADLDDDGTDDLFVTNIHDQTHLALANDRGSFRDVSLALGLGRWSLPATGFGVALFDQDHDGRLDAFIANGEVNIDNRMRVSENPYAQPDHFARLTDRGFVDATAASGVAFADVGRAVASGDYDGDGDVDLLVGNNGGPLRLLRNDNRSGHAWLVVDARTGPGGRPAIGAEVTVTAGGRTWRREIRAQQSYLASADPRAHFGLGAADVVDRLAVRWPDGRETALAGVPVRQVLLVEQDAREGAP